MRIASTAVSSPTGTATEKAAVLAQVENEIDPIRDKAPKMTAEEIRDKYNVHHIVNCPDVDAANAMVTVPGQFGSFGHDYRGDTALMVRDGFQLPGATDEHFAAVEAKLAEIGG